MPAFDALQVGNNVRPIYLLGDFATSNFIQSVGQFHNADGQNIGSAFFSALVGSVSLLFDANGNWDRPRSAPGTIGIPSVNTEGTKITWSCCVTAFVPVANATDFLTITCSTTKTVRILRIQITGLATAAATEDILLIKRSAANTGGTTANQTLVAHDQNDALTNTTIVTYSVNPTGLGTALGTVRNAKLNLGAAGAAGSIIWDFTNRNGKGMVLRTTNSPLLALNWNGAAVPAGTSIDIEIEGTEE